jgi:hypothetical protein
MGFVIMGLDEQCPVVPHYTSPGLPRCYCIAAILYSIRVHVSSYHAITVCSQSRVTVSVHHAIDHQKSRRPQTKRIEPT